MNSDDGSNDLEEIPTVETIPFDSTSEENNNGLQIGTSDDMLRAPLLETTETNPNTTTATTTTATSTDESNTIVSKLTNHFKTIVDIYADQSGSLENIIKGISLVAFVGAFLGIIMPKDVDLPSPVYRYISSIIGYTYFMAWSVSFYPQIITNYQNKSIDGLSTDSSVLAVLNYTCYTLYNVFFYWDGTIRQEYKDRNGPDAEITVQSNDVAFAIHALLLTLLIVVQIIQYGGFKTQPLSKTCIAIIGTTIVLSGIYILCILLDVPGFLWIDFLYIMATVKLLLTIMTYIPQIVLNFHRQSTQGKKKNCYYLK